MIAALLVGTAVAAACGLAGSVLVLRRQVFAADALSHVAFTGALAALALGLDLRVGLFAVTVLVAAGMAPLGRRGRPDDVVVAGVFAEVLGIGVLLLSLYTRSRSAGNGSAGVSVLFGSLSGLDAGTTVVAVVVAVAAVLALLALGRPLLYASLDERGADAAGVPVRALGMAFLVVLGVVTAEATQVVGVLLLLGLLAAPAGAARLLTAHPWRAMVLSAGLAVLAVWGGIGVSIWLPPTPPSFAVLALAGAVYVAAGVTNAILSR